MRAILEFLKLGRAYYRTHPEDKWALIISCIALIVAIAKG